MGEFVTGGLAEWMIDPGIKASERLDDVLFRQSRGDRSWHSYVPEIAQRTGMKKSSFSTALDRQS